MTSILRSFLFVLLVSFFSVSLGQNAKQFIKTGKEFAEADKFEDAIVQFTKAIEMDPDNVAAYQERANSYEKNEQIEEAAKDYERLIALKPSNANHFYNLGRIYRLLGRYDDAMSKLHKATTLNKKHVDALNEKVNTLWDKEDYYNALMVSDSALKLRQTDILYFNHGRVSVKLNSLTQAEKDFENAIKKNKSYELAYTALANVQFDLGKMDAAAASSLKAINLAPNTTRAYIVRSKIAHSKLDYSNAINDLSKSIVLHPEEEELYYLRGIYYQEFSQHQSAINDFNKVISLNPSNSVAYYMRAKSFEQIANFKLAIKDYKKLTTFPNDEKAQEYLKQAKERLYELNRETNKPKIVLLDPKPNKTLEVGIPNNKEHITVKGEIVDESDIEFVEVNGQKAIINKTDETTEFSVDIPVAEIEKIDVKASDVYKNEEVTVFAIKLTEVESPLISLIAPYSSDNGEIFLDSNDPNIYVEGKISDESKIESIFVEGAAASYIVDELNPTFSATINVMNKNKITVTAVDLYGNEKVQEFTLNREGAILSENNPMGKTWVVFIENSNYETFASLDGPSKDVTMMRSALAKYQIHNVIHKKDMTKAQLEKFFSIELRDLVRSNNVSSILLWYAGHGKFINETGYWIPVDATRDDEFTYYNINSLKASMQAYSKYITHTLVITDACESGPTFYQAMRSTAKERSCDDWKATKFKSSQVFSSAGYELAVDNSQFTKTFANALANNPNACLPIENIVSKVTIAVAKSGVQKPKFGKIEGLEDEDGTFFFMAREDE